jgi:dihydroflavonol-4-reductase
MRVFVTGGTGFIGRHLIEHLLAQGDEVTALVRTFERARSLPRAVRTLPGDVLKPETLRPGLRGVEVVFHLAAVKSLGARASEPERMRRINVDATRQVLELAAEAGVPRLVYTSDARVLSVASPAESHYLATKHQAHTEVAHALQQRGWPLTIVCPGPVYGPGDSSPLRRLLRAYVRRRLPILFGADQAQSWAYVTDIAAAHRLAAEVGQPGQTYTFAGPRLSFREFFAACERVSGWPAPRLWLPLTFKASTARMLNRNFPAWAEMMRYLAGQPLPAQVETGQTLGWESRPLTAGIKETLAWAQAQD